MEAEAVMEENPIMEAEVVYPAAGYGAPPAAADDLFGPSGPYGDPMAADNPYKPLPMWSTPPSPAPRKSRRERSSKRPPRPLGIFLLALCHFFGAAVILFGLSVVGPPPLGIMPGSAALTASIFTAVASSVAAVGVGVFKGVKWVWWLEMFGLAWSISRNGISILLALLLPLIPGFVHLAGGLTAFLIFKYLTRVVISSLLLAYLCKENVLAFFGLKRLDTGQALGILFGIAITLTLVLAGIGLFLIRSRFAP